MKQKRMKKFDPDLSYFIVPLGTSDKLRRLVSFESFEQLRSDLLESIADNGDCISRTIELHFCASVRLKHKGKETDLVFLCAMGPGDSTRNDTKRRKDTIILRGVMTSQRFADIQGQNRGLGKLITEIPDDVFRSGQMRQLAAGDMRCVCGREKRPLMVTCKHCWSIGPPNLKEKYITAQSNQDIQGLDAAAEELRAFAQRYTESTTRTEKRVNKDQFPQLNQRERCHVATLVQRLNHLRARHDDQAGENADSYARAEIAALAWVIGKIQHMGTNVPIEPVATHGVGSS